MPDKNIIDKILNAIFQVIIPDKVILFGSQSTGMARIDSDYDLLIIKSNVQNKLIIEQDIYEKLIGIDESIDILVRTPENIEKDRTLYNSLTSKALIEGIVIYEH